MARLGRHRGAVVAALLLGSGPVVAGCGQAFGPDSPELQLQAATINRSPGSTAGAVRTGRRTAPTRRPSVSQVAAANTTSSSTTSRSGTSSSTSTTTTTTTTTALTLRGPCLPLYGPGTPVPISISTTTGSVVLAWWHNGDPAAIAYWVGLAKEPTAAAPSTYPAPRQTIAWTKVTPPTTCQELRVPVPGVERGTNYTVALMLEARTPETTSGVSRVVLNQAGVRLPA